MVRLTTKHRRSRSVIDQFRQSGSMKCLFPRVHDTALQAVLVNTSGGVTGGDRFDVAAHAGADTRLVLTTQACERAYRAMPGQTGEIRTRLRVAEGARIDWLPQETILFDGASVRRRLTVDLAKTGRLLLVEPLIFGRAAMGERLERVGFRDRIEIRRGGRLYFLDTMVMDGAMQDHLDQRFVAGGAGAMALVVLICPEAEAHLDPLREMLPDSAGASLVRPDLLVVRCLAEDSFLLRACLIPLLTRLSGAPLPRCWTI